MLVPGANLSGQNDSSRRTTAPSDGGTSAEDEESGLPWAPVAGDPDWVEVGGRVLATASLLGKLNGRQCCFFEGCGTLRGRLR